MQQFRVYDTNVDTCDIGYDLIDNNYGTQFNNIRGGFRRDRQRRRQPSHWITVLLDLSFYNAWVVGQIAGISISPNGGGYHFWVDRSQEEKAQARQSILLRQ